MGKIGLKPRPVSVGTFRATYRMRQNVEFVLDQNQLSYGYLCKEFEKRFAKIHDSKYAILANSGTSALHVAVQALKSVHGWGSGASVIVPATTFVATANVVRHNRLYPIFADVDPRTYNIDPEYVAKVIRDDTVAIIPVHLLGQPADIHSLQHVIGNLDIKIIEDSCECMFVTHHDRMVGSWGAIGCFSTYVAHLVVTGVGGIATTSNPDYAAKMRSLVNHGLMIEHLNPDENFAPRPTPGRRFRFDDYGHSFRITELEAALGLPQLDTYEDMLRTRRRNAKHLTAGLTLVNKYYDNPIQLPYTEPFNEHAWMMYPIVLNKKDDKIVGKEPLMHWLNERQIETRDLLPMLNQPIYTWLSPTAYPVSDWLCKSGFYVGCHQHLEPADIQYVVQTIEEYFDRKPT